MLSIPDGLSCGNVDEMFSNIMKKYSSKYLLSTRFGVVGIPFKQSRLIRIGRTEDALRELDRKLQGKERAVYIYTSSK